MDELIHRIVVDLLCLLELFSSWSVCGQCISFDLHIKAPLLFCFKFFLYYSNWYLLDIDGWQCYFLRLEFMFGFFLKLATLNYVFIRRHFSMETCVSYKVFFPLLYLYHPMKLQWGAATAWKLVVVASHY